MKNPPLLPLPPPLVLKKKSSVQSLSISILTSSSIYSEPKAEEAEDMSSTFESFEMIEKDGYKVVKLNQNPSFEMVVVGCGGGPLETNLSSYIVKLIHRNWEDEGALLGIEAGSFCLLFLQVKTTLEVDSVM
jgi:hypothetical protein